MNIGAIISLGLQFFFAKSGFITTHVAGKTQHVTVSEVGAAGPAPLGHLTFGSAVTLAEEIVGLLAGGGQPVNQQVRVGADVYQVSVTE